MAFKSFTFLCVFLFLFQVSLSITTDKANQVNDNTAVVSDPTDVAAKHEDWWWQWHWHPHLPLPTPFVHPPIPAGRWPIPHPPIPSHNWPPKWPFPHPPMPAAGKIPPHWPWIHPRLPHPPIPAGRIPHWPWVHPPIPGYEWPPHKGSSNEEAH